MAESSQTARVHMRPGTESPKFAAQDVRMEEVDCPSCGSKRSRPVARIRDYEIDIDMTFSVRTCEECGLSYTSPRPVFDDLLRIFYGEDYLCYQHGGLISTIRRRLLGKSHHRLFAPYVPDGGRILDVGCGTGEMLDYLHVSSGWAVVGCEPKASVAQNAADRGFRVIPKTLRDAEFDPDTFDLVNMNHVIEHLPDLKETVAEVFRVLKPGGVFITENPDFGGITRSVFKDAWWGYHLPRHLTHFTPETLRVFLEKQRFEVLRIEPCLRPVPSWLGPFRLDQAQRLADCVGQSVWHEQPGLCGGHVSGRVHEHPAWPDRRHKGDRSKAKLTGGRSNRFAAEMRRR